MSAKLLLTKGGEAPPLLSLASTIYRTALMAYLEEHWPRNAVSSPETASWKEEFEQRGRDYHVVYEDHLLNAIGKRYWD